MRRDYLGHAVTLALALAGSAVMVKKCPPVPVPAGKPAEAAPEIKAPAAVVPVVPVAPVAPPTSQTPASKAEGLTPDAGTADAKGRDL